MCDECEYCGCGAWQRELRAAPDGNLICHDCHDDGQSCDGDTCAWHDLPTLDELAEAHIAAADDRAHAMAERRAGL